MNLRRVFIICLYICFLYTAEFKIALKLKPKFVCIVPERREEVTTEGGLNLNYNLDSVLPGLVKVRT